MTAETITAEQRVAKWNSGVGLFSVFVLVVYFELIGEELTLWRLALCLAVCVLINLLEQYLWGTKFSLNNDKLHSKGSLTETSIERDSVRSIEQAWYSHKTLLLRTAESTIKIRTGDLSNKKEFLNRIVSWYPIVPRSGAAYYWIRLALMVTFSISAIALPQLPSLDVPIFFKGFGIVMGLFLFGLTFLIDQLSIENGLLVKRSFWFKKESIPVADVWRVRDVSSVSDTDTSSFIVDSISGQIVCKDSGADYFIWKAHLTRVAIENEEKTMI